MTDDGGCAVVPRPLLLTEEGIFPPRKIFFPLIVIIERYVPVTQTHIDKF